MRHFLFYRRYSFGALVPFLQPSHTPGRLVLVTIVTVRALCISEVRVNVKIEIDSVLCEAGPDSHAAGPKAHQKSGVPLPPLMLPW